jgi:hypothetical protein
LARLTGLHSRLPLFIVSIELRALNFGSMSQEVTDTDLLQDRLAQGDILRWSNPEVAEAEYGIIVTADCDLAHNKMKGIVSYVPLLRFDTYVATVWAPEYLSKRVQKILEGVAGSIREAHKLAGSTQNLSEQAIRAWLIRDEATDIASQLLPRTTPPKIVEKLVREISIGQKALLLQRDLSIGNGTRYIDRLTTAAATLFPEGKGNASTIINALDGHCSSLPGDIFFVSHLPNESDKGYFALLRHIRQCKLEDLSLDPAQRPGPNLPARRIGRLGSPFIYALTRQLASVFADIGLPVDHSTRLSTCTKMYLSGAGK